MTITDKAQPLPLATLPVAAGRHGGQRRNLRAYLALAPFVLLYGVLIVIPTLGLVVKSLSTSQSAELELLNPSSLIHTSFTLANYKALFTQADHLTTIWTTIAISLVAVALTVTVGTPIAYQLAADRTRLTGPASWVLSLPIYMPTVVIAYALVLLFGPNGILTRLRQPCTSRSGISPTPRPPSCSARSMSWCRSTYAW